MPQPVRPAAIHQAPQRYLLWHHQTQELLQVVFQNWFLFFLFFFISLLQINESTSHLILAPLWAVEIRYGETRPLVFKLYQANLYKLYTVHCFLASGGQNGSILLALYPRPRSLVHWFTGFQLNLVFILLVGSWSPLNSML